MLHLQLLGPLLVQDNDRGDLTPPGARERNGLATLAVVSPESLSTERLAVELYRERDTTDPRNAVQAMVSRLRRGLGRAAGSVETTANGYRLVDITVDIDEAERLLQAAVAESHVPTAVRLLDEALGLWHGPTLDGLTGELIDAERLRLDGLRWDAEDLLFERRILIEEDPGLVAALERAVRDQPLREKRWELLMRVLYGQGRQADALRAFQRARSLLSNHLGLEPGPALARLEQQILAHDPALDRPHDPQSTTAATLSARPDPDSHSDSDSDSDSERQADPVDLPAGTVSVLLCDVEGSVKRWESAPDDTAREIAQLHDIWADAVRDHGGHLVKSTGDGVLAVFSTAATAITAGVTAMRRHNEISLLVKVAVHTGSLQPVDDDYRGPVVNRCARLLDLAHGGQILASGTTADLARPELSGLAMPDEQPITLRDLGSHRLRDVPDPLPVWQVEGAGIRADFPPLRSEVPQSIPRLRGELLGRESLIAEVSEAVGEERLVTLLGPGGIGKTSMALAVAWEVAGGRPLTFVDLARVADPSAVELHLLAAIVAADHDDDRDRAEQIADRLRANTDLVVIDNAEHVLDAVASVVDRVLHHDLKGSFLVTSRQPLGLADEAIIGVPPLELPDDGADLGATGRTPAVQLFVERAKMARPDLRIQSGLLPVVAHICRRLDGIPLAIELAAGRASLLSIDDIAARLDDQLRLLRQVRSQRDRRHRSLEVVVGWSVEQLSPEARDLFGRLSVMAGGFGIDGVETMLGHCGLKSLDALEALDELAGASLLTVEPEGSHFRMLEPIRQVAQAELVDRGIEPETRRAHVRWMIDLVTTAHRVRDESRQRHLAVVDQEQHQLRAAISWIAENDQPDLAAEIAFPSSWWFLTRDSRSGERLLGQLLALADKDRDPVGWAESVLALGITTAAHPRSAVAESSLEAVEIFDANDHPDRGVARLAAAFAQSGDLDITVPLGLLQEAEPMVSSDDLWARSLIDMASMTMQALIMSGTEGPRDPEPVIDRGLRAASVFRRFGENWALGATLGELGRLYQSLGRMAEAEDCYSESLELFVDADYHGSHYILSELGRMASHRGDHLLADQYHNEAFALAEADGNPGCLAMAVAGLGHAAEARDDHQAALDFYEQASALSQEATLIEHGHDEWRQAIIRLKSKLR